MKIAIAGIGNVARNQYIPFLAGVADVTLGYYNRTSAVAEETATKHGGEVFDTLEGLVGWKPDAVLVLTSETIRDEVASQLIELGARRLFFEKPLVARGGQAHVTEDDFVRGRHLIHLAEEHGCETAMVFNYRFFDHAVKTQKLIAERDLGGVVGIYGATHYACWSHCIDLALLVAGDVVEIAGTEGTSVRPSFEAVDVTAAFRLTGGGAGTIVGTCGWSFESPLYDLTFIFERGRIRIQDLDGTLDLIDGVEARIEQYEPPVASFRWDRYDRSFGRSLAAYLDTLRSGARPPIPGTDGLKELQFEAALKRSIAQRRTVDVQKEFPL